MRAKYKYSQDTSEHDDSEYESDGETRYKPKKNLGKGRFVKARLFCGIDAKNKPRTTVVLNPVNKPGDIEEAQFKFRFFQQIYPENQSHLFDDKEDGDYRLIVPYISGAPYERLKIDTQEFEISLFKSAVKALQACHDKGIVVLDVHAENIYYNLETQQSFLIDGGSSTLIGTPIDKWMFQKPDQKTVEQYQKNYIQIAPECWSVEPHVVLATPAMDIYSLGDMMGSLQISNPELKSLIAKCLNANPDKRPKLEELADILDRCLQQLTLKHFVCRS